MSTSLLYHAFGIRGYNLINTQFIGGNVFFWIEEPLTSLRCPVCRSPHVKSARQSASLVPFSPYR